MSKFIKSLIPDDNDPDPMYPTAQIVLMVLVVFALGIGALLIKGIWYLFKTL